MRRHLFAAVVFGICVFTWGIPRPEAQAAERPEKSGIVLVAFGTSAPEAAAAYAAVEARVRAAFPDLPLRWAYTSSTVCAKLASQGRALDSLESGLARMEAVAQLATRP
jgi:sirohydrochlorin cobaltochelatase